MKLFSLTVVPGSVSMILLAGACLPFKQTAESEVPSVEDRHYYTLDGQIPEDAEFVNWLAPYRELYQEEMGRELTTTEASLKLHNPESALGNLAADMIRSRAAYEMGGFVHMALINRHELRTELPGGTITYEDLYELIPGDSKLVILELTGDRLIELAGEIARKGGAPISGMRLGINEGEARGVLVNAETVMPDRQYYVATTSYIADHDNEFESLQQYSERRDFPVLIRDLFIDYMSSRRNLEPNLDQRIRSLGS